MTHRRLKIILLTVLLLLAKPQSVLAQTTYYFSPTFEKTDGVVTKYYPLPGGVTAMRKNTELSYLHTDHLASTRLVTSNSGAIVNQLDYYPYGSLQSINNQLTINTPSINRLYTSQILDSSTDLYFYNARQYNPVTAAFISADTAQGPNRYAYVSGNPISRNDPSGNQPENLDEYKWQTPQENPQTIPDWVFKHYRKGSGYAHAGLDIDYDYRNWQALNKKYPNLATFEQYVSAMDLGLRVGPIASSLKVVNETTVKGLTQGAGTNLTNAKRYLGGRIVNMLDRYLLHRNQNDLTLIDIGSSTGTAVDNLVAEFSEYNIRAIALDINEEMLKNGVRNGVNAHMIQGNAASLPLASNTADVAILTNVLPYYESMPSALAVLANEAERILKIGGLLITGADSTQFPGHIYDFFIKTARGFTPFN